jgi:ribosome biogenesis GTPase
VGKSTLVNSLLGAARQDTQAVREDDLRGRHTTTYRELIPTPGGGMVVDTPGMRELQLWTTEDGLERSFEDIEGYAGSCRFSDCRHESEPGCAVRRALETGELDAARWQSYLKLKRELDYLSRRQDHAASLVEKTKWKKIHMLQREINKHR